MRLHVHLTPSKIRVIPLATAAVEERLAGTFAKNEAMLATVFLSIADAQDLPLQLVQYFRHRGWQVEQW